MRVTATDASSRPAVAIADTATSELIEFCGSEATMNVTPAVMATTTGTRMASHSRASRDRADSSSIGGRWRNATMRIPATTYPTRAPLTDET